MYWQNLTSMDSEIYQFEKLEPIPQKYGYTVVFMTIVFFQTLNRLVTNYGPPKTVEEDETWKWKNIFISWIHALASSFWALACIYSYSEILEDLIAFHNFSTYALVGFSTGYFLYDASDIILTHHVGQNWQVMIHHALVITSFGYNLVYCRCVAFNVVALLVEVNSVFLHTRKLLQMYKVPFRSGLYRINAMGNIISFIPCRFAILAYMFYGLYTWGHRINSFNYNMLMVIVSCMLLVNIALFCALLKNDVFRSWFHPEEFLEETTTSSGSSKLVQNGNHTTCKNDYSHVINGKHVISNNNVNHIKEN